MALSFSRRDRVFIPTWRGNAEQGEGERIQVSYRPLCVADMFVVQRETKVNLFGGFTVDPADIEAFAKYWGLVAYVLEHYTSDYRNIVVDGVPVQAAKELLEAAQVPHMELIAEVFNRVVMESMGTAEQAKNSGPDSVPESAGSGTPAPAVPPTSSESATVEAST